MQVMIFRRLLELVETERDDAAEFKALMPSASASCSRQLATGRILLTPEHLLLMLVDFSPHLPSFFFCLRLTGPSGYLSDGPGNYKYKTKCTWLIEGQ